MAACVAGAAAAQTAVESALGTKAAGDTLLASRAAPALLWTLAAPAVMTLGARHRPRGGRILAPALLHA
ncbi:MAG TPA: hypothetical protein VJ997_15300, partial [Longimicrobiales bacterium]|nr:hypothetical protein [Longimicrobiales bacterium]